MELKPIGHGYTIIPQDDGTYQVAMIISEHDNEHEAITAMLEAMRKESNEIMKKEIEELRKQGINAKTLEDAVKDMTPEQLENFLEERRRKFINSLLNMNIEMLEQKKRKLKTKRKK